jgi:glycosyltransferase involved in cell wall biosynthesis
MLLESLQMKKKTIVLASLLKPVDDTRMFEKFGISLSDSGHYDVVIIGYPSSVKPAYPNVSFMPLSTFKRISIERLLAPLKVLAKLYKVKHDILIVNTHELLMVALLNRIIFGGKIIYDIQENYYRNILHTNAFPKWARPILAYWVRAKEKLTSPFFHGFFLAEKGYEKEVRFASKNVTVLENKPRIQGQLVKTSKPGKTQLLFSGTLAESTGVFEAIRLAKSLHKLDKTIALHIIGFAARNETYQKIMNDISGLDFITLIGGNHLVPHTEVMKAIFEADFGIISYPPSPHVENSMPTKLYEYVAAKLPILLCDHKPWVEFCHQYSAALILSDVLKTTELLSLMKSEVFYKKETADVSWLTEEQNLFRVLDEI